MIARMFQVMLLALLCSFAQQAQAQTCTFSATDVNFGAVDSLGSGATDVAGTVNVRCAAFLGLLSSIQVTINLGEGRGGANASTRTMKSVTTATPLNYQLYRDAGHTQVWGSSTWAYGGAPVVLTGAAVLTALTTTGVQVQVYGRVPGSQSSVVPGSYISAFNRDPIDVHVNYRTCNLLLLCTNRDATFAFNALATVAPDCLVTAQDLAFGTVGLLNSPVDAAGRVDVTCTAQTAYNIGLSYGLYGSGPGRFMQSPAGDQIGYDLYRNAGRTLLWGTLLDGVAQPGAGAGSAQTYPVYGRVPAQTTPPPGVYADTVVVTVTY